MDQLKRLAKQAAPIASNNLAMTPDNVNIKGAALVVVESFIIVLTVVYPPHAQDITIMFTRIKQAKNAASLSMWSRFGVIDTIRDITVSQILKQTSVFNDSTILPITRCVEITVKHPEIRYRFPTLLV